MRKYSSEYYVLPDSKTINREYGKTPNGNRMAGAWVYRDTDGNLIDFDKYRADLFDRNGLEE